MRWQPGKAKRRFSRGALGKGGPEEPRRPVLHELVAATGLLPTLVERGLAELVSAGLVAADSFSGLRALLAPQSTSETDSCKAAGRWSLLNQKNTTTEQIAQGLLKRYGVVFRALLQRESLRRGGIW